MGNILKIFIFICGLLSVGAILNLLIKRRINERNSLFWLLGATAIFVLSAMPELLELMADAVGVDYPPTLLFLFSILILLLIVLNQSIQISLLNEQLKELTQHVALNSLKNDCYTESAAGRQPEIDLNAHKVEEDE